MSLVFNTSAAILRCRYVQGGAASSAAASAARPHIETLLAVSAGGIPWTRPGRGV